MWWRPISSLTNANGIAFNHNMAHGVIVDLDFPMQLIVKLDDWLGYNNDHDLLQCCIFDSS
jgi:hypothetical protein